MTLQEAYEKAKEFNTKAIETKNSKMVAKYGKNKITGKYEVYFIPTELELVRTSLNLQEQYYKMTGKIASIGSSKTNQDTSNQKYINRLR